MNINLIAAQIFENCVNPKTTVKAKRIYNNCKITLQKIEDDVFYFLCQSETDEDHNYEVEIDFTNVDDPAPVCDCRQHENENFCKHVAGCLIFLQKSGNTQNVTLIESGEKSIKMATITEKKSHPENGNASYTQKYISNNLNEWSIFYGLTESKKCRLKDLLENGNVSILFESKQKSLTANVLDGKKNIFSRHKKNSR